MMAVGVTDVTRRLLAFVGGEITPGFFQVVTRSGKS